MGVPLLCEITQVSKSGYYQWLKHSGLPDPDWADYLLIKELFDRGKKKLGFRSIRMKLERQGVIMNHKKIQRIMKKFQLFARIRRKNPYKMIMKKSLEHRTVENLLNRAFHQLIPFRILCTDITYLFFNHRVAYLSVVKDIATGEVVAWHLAMHLEMSLVLNTVEELKKHDMIATLVDVMLHSDQGFHYTNPQFIEQLKSLNMAQSMSRKGNCIDNAPIESFFGHLKDDVDYKYCKSFQELHAVITNYMHYYNHERQQWNLKKMTPVEYRNHLLTAA